MDARPDKNEGKPPKAGLAWFLAAAFIAPVRVARVENLSPTPKVNFTLSDSLTLARRLLDETRKQYPELFSNPSCIESLFWERHVWSVSAVETQANDRRIFRDSYRMRPGVLTRTNGVSVMAAPGLLPLPKPGTTEATTQHSTSTLDYYLSTPGSSATRS